MDMKTSYTFGVVQCDEEKTVDAGYNINILHSSSTSHSSNLRHQLQTLIRESTQHLCGVGKGVRDSFSY